MRTQLEKAKLFHALHERPGTFIIPNPYDAGSAKLLAAAGFEALATTSLGLANMLGQDRVSLSEIIENARVIVEATDLPVSIDLEDCGADAPKIAAEAIRLTAEAGAVGGSIEDTSASSQRSVYDFTLAVERVQAAVEVARALPIPFMLTARAENFLYGRTDIDDTVRRLQAYEAAGADVLYAPGLYDLATIKTVVSALKKPFNLVMGFADPTLTVEQLSGAGVKRISVGGALSRIALAAFIRCAHEMKDKGSFTFVREMATIQELREAFAAGRPPASANAMAESTLS
jgi:2-methylisocitrate lyase-like PEP mutase family enzyme